MHKPCLSIGEYACDPGADLTNLLLSARRSTWCSPGTSTSTSAPSSWPCGTGCSVLTIGTYNASCVVDSDDALTKGAGTVFATVGTGGTALRDVNLADPEAGYFAASSGANQNPTYGFGDFDVTPDKLTAKFVRGSGGTFTDAFTIDQGRHAAAPTRSRSRPSPRRRSGLTATLRRLRDPRPGRHHRVVRLGLRRRLGHREHGCNPSHLRRRGHLPGHADGHRRRRGHGHDT